MRVMEPFVGRVAELETLARAAGEARAGHSSVVVIEGEAGMGKSSLLNRWLNAEPAEVLLRASGDEEEQMLAYGVVSQVLTQAARAGAGRPALPRGRLNAGVDSIRAGGAMLSCLGDLQGAGRTVLLVVDDLHWADGPSARALLFTLRRLDADRVLVACTVRPGDAPRLGDGWLRFLAGNDRCTVLRLHGLRDAELGELASQLDAGPLSPRALRRLSHDAGGVPLYCRALLQELGSQGLEEGSRLRPPLVLAEVISLRQRALPVDAQALVNAAAVLGTRCRLDVAAELAGVQNPLAALEATSAAGLLTEPPGATEGELSFPHVLVRHAVYDQLGPSERRQLHAMAARLVDRDAALDHRVAARYGPDPRLAEELEQAAHRVADLGDPLRAGGWLAQAAASTDDPEARERWLLDAFQTLVEAGEVSDAERLVPPVEHLPASARQRGLLGAFDLAAGRLDRAEARLVEAWHRHEGERTQDAGAAVALELAKLALVTARIEEAIVWVERALGSRNTTPAFRSYGLGLRAIILGVAGRPAEGLDGLSFLPPAPTEAPIADSDALVARGMARLAAEDLEAAIADLATAKAREEAGVRLRLASQCLTILADAEYRFGDWDSADLHAGLAVSIAEDSGRFWDFAFVHGIASFVPAGRGEWELAGRHVTAAWEAARSFGAPEAIAAAATAEARLAAARGDHGGVVRAAAAVRKTGRAEYLGRPGHWDWRALEVEAWLGLGDLQSADSALSELDAAVRAGRPRSALVDAARLRGELRLAGRDAEGAAAAYARAWRLVDPGTPPLCRALWRRRMGCACGERG